MNVANSFGIYTMGQAFNALLRFLLVPYYSYILTGDDFGKIGMIWIITPVLSIVGGLAATVAVSIKYYKFSDEIRTMMINFALVAVSAWFFIILMSIISANKMIDQFLILNIDTSYYSKLVMVSYTGFLIEFFLGLFKNQFKPLKFVIYNTLYTITSITCTVFFIVYLERGFLGFIDGNLYGNAIIAIVLFFDYFIHSSTKKIRIEKKLLYDWIKIGTPVIIGFFLSYVMNYSGRYFIADLSASFSNLGIYTMGLKFGDAFNLFFVTSYMMAANPIIIRSFSQLVDDHNEYKLNMIKYTNLYILSGGLLFLFANSILGVIFNFIIDIKYLDSIPIVQLSMFAYLIFGLGQVFGMTILVKEKLFVTTYFGVVTGILTILLNLWLVPKLQVIGAVLVTVTVYAVLTILFYIFSQKLLKISYQYKRNIVFILLVSICFFIQELMGAIFIEAVLIVAIFKISIVFFLIGYVFKMELYHEIDGTFGKIKNCYLKIRGQ